MPGAREIEVIVWEDPYVLDRPWNSPEELDEKIGAFLVTTVGFVAKETQAFVVLAQGYSLKKDFNEVEEWGHCWVIPQKAIVSRKTLLDISEAPSPSENGGDLRTVWPEAVEFG